MKNTPAKPENQWTGHPKEGAPTTRDGTKFRPNLLDHKELEGSYKNSLDFIWASLYILRRHLPIVKAIADEFCVNLLSFDRE